MQWHNRLTKRPGKCQQYPDREEVSPTSCLSSIGVLVFSTPGSKEGLRFRVDIFLGKMGLFSNDNGGYDNREYFLTPARSTVYILRLTGSTHYGKYEVTMDLAASE